MKELKIQKVIKGKRLERNLSQEALAEAFGISVQAVSKWETGLSYPDITLLPKICDYFHLNMDTLFYGEEENKILEQLPDDNNYRVVQCIGRKIISHDEYNGEKRIKLSISQSSDSQINMEIWGSADIKGDVNGNVTAGGGVNCGGVDGNVEAGGGVNCGGVDGYLEAGGSVNCGGVDGYLKAGGSVNCGNVEGDVTCENNLSCGNIKGNATAKKIKCKKIGGNVNCDKVIIKKYDDDDDDLDED